MSGGATPEPGDDDGLTIGELAARTAVGAATLRMWEQRHGFPVPLRLANGHRRYTAADVDAVTRVRTRQSAGIRLDVAVAEETERDRPVSRSVYAELRARHPQLGTHRLTKATLLALSWAIEDEVCSRADRPHLFGSFQLGHYYERADERWRELARTASSTYVLADFGGATPTARGPLVTVGLPTDAPMLREWAVVCDAAALPVALTAWELPGQSRVPDRDRVFESVWTLDPVAVRDASRVCAQLCAERGAPGAELVAEALAEPAPRTTPALAATTSLFNRVLVYADRHGRRSGSGAGSRS